MSRLKLLFCALFGLAAGALINNAAAQSLKLLGEFRVPTNLKFGGVPIGGLSALEYDAQRNVFLALSDDRAQRGPARFYTLKVDIDENGIRGIDVVSSTEIKRADGSRFAPKSIDPEAMRLLSGMLYWASERNSEGIPYVGIMDLATATQQRSFAVPDYYLPTGASGIRDNLGFESLTLIGSEKLVVANEQGMRQDGPQSTVDNGSPARVLTIDLKTGAASAEFVYITEKIAARPIPGDGFTTNGLVEMLAMPMGESLLAFERSYSRGQGNVIRIFKAQFKGATNVLGRAALGADYRPMPKKLVYTLAVGETFTRVDNIEGATFGPKVDGNDTLVLVSDNNFNHRQVTQFIAFTVHAE